MNRTPIEWCRTYAEDGSFEEGFSVNSVRFRPYGSTPDGKPLRSMTMCQKVSPGCKHCYAEGIMRRFWPKAADSPFPGYTAAGLLTGEFVLDEEHLLSVLRRKKPTKIFWGDMTDLFQESVPDAFLDRCFAVCALTPQHTHMFLTKRAERMRAYFGKGGAQRSRIIPHVCALWEQEMRSRGVKRDWTPIVLPNVWLGVSVENQEQADKRLPHLFETPAAVKFISAEPLLGAVNIKLQLSCYRWVLREPLHFFKPQPDDYGKAIDWVIVGGESGPGARPMHPDWVRGLRDQCVAAGVPFFFKQWGEWSPIDLWIPSEKAPQQRAIKLDGSCVAIDEVPQDVGGQRFARVGKKAAGNLLDGKQWHQFPEVARG